MQGTQAQPMMQQPQLQVQQPQAGGLTYAPVMVGETTWNSLRPGFAHKKALKLGIVQVVLGILAMVIQIVHIACMIEMFDVGHGIWCGALVSVKSLCIQS